MFSRGDDMMTPSHKSTFGHVAALAAVALFLVVGGATPGAAAAEIKVLCSTALKDAMLQLGPQFEHASEHKLAATFAASTTLKKQIDAGAAFDVALLTPDLIDDLTKAAKIDPASVAKIARTGIGIAIKAGAARPDIGTVAALKQTLLATRSITYGDPARGGLSSVYFAQLLEKLGIADAMKPKTLLTSGGEGVGPVAAGQAELGVGQNSELMLVAGVERLGPLPAELQSYTNVWAAIAAGSHEKDGAKALIQFLAAPAALPVLRAKGLEPL
jgi:molybdate transport system substrate-binding protein